jgi:hypothetical protein
MMPGFVDVSGMTYEDVRRMGHADDYDDVDHAPRRRNTVLQTGHSVSDVWAAASAAQRINGEYVKESTYTYNEASGQTVLDKRRNRDIMMEFLQNPDRLLTEDVEAGEAVRTYLEQDLVLRALKGKLTDFDASVQRVLAVKDRFYTVTHNYELAVAASLPNSVIRSQQRQNSDTRLQLARGGFIAQPGAKITARVEVLTCNYSKEYNIFWVRGITDQDEPVMFSAKEKFDAGTWLDIQGKVKAHRDNLTQLNYVKVL